MRREPLGTACRSEGRRCVTLATVIAGLVFFPFGGCAKTRTDVQMKVGPEIIESTRRFQKEYVLAPGDAIDVVVRGNADVSRACVIRPDGFISLPLLDEIKAEGLTASQLDGELTRKLAARLRDPEVTVIATSVRQPVVYVVGEVGTPRPVPLRDAPTVAAAIAYAGDMAVGAAKDQVAVVRLSEEGYLRAYTLSPGGEGQPAWYMALQATTLRADDIVVVPESDRAQFVRFVNDFVNTPLSGINQVLSPYFQFTIIEKLDE